MRSVKNLLLTGTREPWLRHLEHLGWRDESELSVRLVFLVGPEWLEPGDMCSPLLGPRWIGVAQGELIELFPDPKELLEPVTAAAAVALITANVFGLCNTGNGGCFGWPPNRKPLLVLLNGVKQLWLFEVISCCSEVGGSGPIGEWLALTTIEEESSSSLTEWQLPLKVPWKLDSGDAACEWINCILRMGVEFNSAPGASSTWDLASGWFGLSFRVFSPLKNDAADDDGDSLGEVTGVLDSVMIASTFDIISIFGEGVEGVDLTTAPLPPLVFDMIDMILCDGANVDPFELVALLPATDKLATVVLACCFANIILVRAVVANLDCSKKWPTERNHLHMYRFLSTQVCWTDHWKWPPIWKRKNWLVLRETSISIQCSDYKLLLDQSNWRLELNSSEIHYERESFCSSKVPLPAISLSDIFSRLRWALNVLSRWPLMVTNGPGKTTTEALEEGDNPIATNHLPALISLWEKTEMAV